MITSMPKPPVDMILGDAPRWYFDGDKCVPANSTIITDPAISLGVPIPMPKEISQDHVLKYQMVSKGSKNKEGIQIEDIRVADHTKESFDKYINIIKTELAKDIIEKGIPIEWAKEIEHIPFVFRKKRYMVKTEDLKLFNLLVDQLDPKERINPLASPLVMNLSKVRLTVPVESDNHFCLFTAQYLAGTELASEYMKKKEEYIRIFNDLMDLINSFEYGKNKLTTLWTVIYGSNNWYGTVERVKLY